MKKNNESPDSVFAPELDRRAFLKLSGGAALGAATLSNPLAVIADDDNDDDDVTFKIEDSWSDKKLWQEVKKLFVMDKKSTYMNIGTTGSMPKQVLDNYAEYNETVAKYPWDMNGEWGDWPYTNGLVDRIAPQFRCDASELVISRNTTDGTTSMLHGLDLRQGDHVIATHHEHVAVTSPLWVLTTRFGVDVEYVEIPVFPESEDDYLDVIAAAIRPETRLIVASHITYKTGATLPIKRICQELAVPNGIVTLIDGAHTSGMLNLDFHDLDCDLYAASGHKWQCGPGGTGLLYVRDEASRIEEFWPDRHPLFAVNSSLAHYAATFGLQMALQYKGNDNYPALRALADSCDLWDLIGRDRIQERVLGLSALTKELIRDSFPDAILYSPDSEPSLTSAITSFNPFADQTDGELIAQFRDRLREEYSYIIRYTDFDVHTDDPAHTYAMRISTHLFHDEDDVEGLVQAMADLYSKL